MNNHKKNILDKLEELERQSRIAAAREIVERSTTGLETVEEMVDIHRHITHFDEVQREFVKKLLRIVALDTVVHSAHFFKHTLNAPDCSLEVHQSAWCDMTNTLRDFMISFDPHLSLEENYTNIWKHDTEN